MLLHQLVKINETGLVANAVNFSLMEDSDKNLRLCEGFIFNHDTSSERLPKSTVGILDALRRSFHGPNEPNIHLLVQDYGKGKSHFALTVANFFSKPEDSAEVRGILKQVEYATGENHPFLKALRGYKRRGRHLVICLSGDRALNLRKHFLQVLNQELEREGITKAIALRICQEPLNYLENLVPGDRQKAEDFLQQTNAEIDLDGLIEELKDNNYEVISTVKDICKEITGITPDFEANVDLENILSDVIENLCQGQDSVYQGVIILFDELYNYLLNWSSDTVAAGGLSLQSITNICERYKSKIAFLCLTQKRPSSYTPKKESQEYQRISSRLELQQSTYEPIASLERVVGGLLSQKTKNSDWIDFFKRHQNTILDLNTKIYQKRTANYYESRGWESRDFYEQITLGCFPLHPLTTYLLCNLDFTQGRTAIQFIQTEVKRFIETESVEKNGRLNLIYPIVLVDAFENNFANSQSSQYSDFCRSRDKISASASPEELTVLKAIFLFYAATGGGSKAHLTKLENEPHEEILELLTGIPTRTLKEILKRLKDDLNVIYYTKADNTYRFYSGGIGITDFLKRIEEKSRDRKPSLTPVQEYLQNHIADYLDGETVIPQQFVQQNKLIGKDWQFACIIFTLSEFHQALKNPHKFPDSLGNVAYIIAETSEELNQLRQEINTLLTPPNDNSNTIQHRLAVAIAYQPASELARVIDTLKLAHKEDIQEWGEARTQGIKQLAEHRDRLLKSLFQNQSFHSHLNSQISTRDRQNISFVISELLTHLYPLIPTVAGVDKMAVNNSRSSGIIGYVCKRLLAKDLKPKAFPNNSYLNLVDPVFVNAWRILSKTSECYTVKEPENSNIKAAWDRISKLVELPKNDKEKTVKVSEIWQQLSSPPYGYNENTFSVLFTSWLVYHRSEVLLKGGFGIPKTKRETVPIVAKSLQYWEGTNVFDKPKVLVHDWILKPKSQLIRRKIIIPDSLPKSLDYDRAKQFIEEYKRFLENPSDRVDIELYTKGLEELENGVKQLDRLLKPVTEVDTLTETEDLETYIKLLINLDQPLNPIDESNVTITASDRQTDKQREAKIKVVGKIREEIESLRDRIAFLKTEAECGGQQTTIQNIQEKLHKIEALPRDFDDLFQEIATKIQTKIESLKKSEISISPLDLLNQIEMSSTPTVRSCEDAIAQIEKLEKPENYLPQFEKKIKAFRNQIYSFCQQIRQLRDRLAKIDNLKQLESIREEYNQVGYIFRDSKYDSYYRKIQDSIRKVKEDFDRLQKLEISTQNCSAIAQCQETLKTLQTKQNKFNTPSRFQKNLQSLEKTLQNKIEKASQQLDKYSDQFRKVKTSQDAVKQKEALLTQKTHYLHSDLVDRYNEIYQESCDLVELFRLYEKTPLNTLFHCQQTQEQMYIWMNQTDPLTPCLDNHFKHFQEKLEEKETKIRKELVEKAKKWVKEIGQSAIAMRKGDPGEEKVKQAQNILDRIQQEQTNLMQYLESTLQGTVRQVEDICQKAIAEHQQEQILLLFQELTSDQKQQIYQKLRDYMG